MEKCSGCFTQIRPIELKESTLDCKSHKLPTNVATALQSPIRSEQDAVDNGCNGEDTSNDCTGSGW